MSLKFNIDAPKFIDKSGKWGCKSLNSHKCFTTFSTNRNNLPWYLYWYIPECMVCNKSMMLLLNFIYMNAVKSWNAIKSIIKLCVIKVKLV